MKRITRLAAAAAIVASACATTADANAMSLGAPGTKLSGPGQIPWNYPFTFGNSLPSGKAIQVACDSKTQRFGGDSLNVAGAVLSDGTAALTFPTAQCRMVYPTPQPVAVSINGILRLRLTALGQHQDGSLTVERGPLVFKFGTCTLTVPAGSRLPNSRDTGAQFSIHNDGFEHFGGALNYYTGSVGCPVEHRGTHLDLNTTAWWQTLTGLRPTA